MPGDEDIQLIAQRIEEGAREVQEGDLPLDERVRKAAEALDLYRSFKRHCASARFDVKVLERAPDGKLSEKEFDLKGLAG
jgi:hypothetical protein